MKAVRPAAADQSSAQQRLEAWLDPGSLASSDARDGSVVCATGTLGGRSVVAGAIDARRARGAIGTVEAAMLEALFVAAQARACPLLLYLDSAGARLDQGVAALAAFRKLFAVALRVRHAGVPLIAVIGPACYGGASMLASLAQRRIYTAASRLGMSGPRIVQAFCGRDVFNASDPRAVGALFGGIARTALASEDCLCADDPQIVREALMSSLDALPRTVASSFEADHAALLSRLRGNGIEIPRNPRPVGPLLKRRLDGCFPQGFEALLGTGVVRGVRSGAGQEITITGLVESAPLGAEAAWMVAESIVTSVRARPDRPIVLLYDSPGHAATRADEAVLLSGYVTHLARALLWARERGVAVSTWILGEASGGAYVAFTAAAQRVVAFPGVDLRILPQAAVSQVLASAPGMDPGRGRWRALGLIDDQLENDTLPPAVAAAAGLPAG